VKVVLANLGDQPCQVEKGDGIAELNIERIDSDELQEVAQLHDTQRGDQGFGCSDTTMDRGVRGQNVKPQREINEISARACGQFYRKAETPGILRGDEIDHQIGLEGINISTGMAIKNQKNNEEQDFRDRVPQEYNHLVDVFKKGEIKTLPPYRPGIDLGIQLEKGKTEPIKTKYPSSYH